MPPLNPTHRNNSIDLLRGLSILSVILLHLNIHLKLTESALSDWLHPKIFSLFFWSGYYGVVIFFTLSGYLITKSILDRYGNLSNIKHKTFYTHRSARILPLLLLIVLVLSVLHLLQIKGYTLKVEHTNLGQAIFSTLTFHINWVQIHAGGYLPANWDVLWSISIEESFYLCFPLVCLLLKKDRYFIFVLIAFLILSPWARTQIYPDNEVGFRNHFGHLDSLALGCMTAVLMKRVSLSKKQIILCSSSGIGLMILVLVFRSWVYQSGLTSLGLNVSLLSVGVSLLLMGLHQSQGQTQKKQIPYLGWLQNMGRYSYEIYLTHMFIIIPGVLLLRSYQLENQLELYFVLLATILSYVLGSLLFNGFSEPINQSIRNRYTSKIT